MMKYIDAHCHPNLPEFASDCDVVIKRALEVSVGMIVVGTGKETSRIALDLATKYENVWAIVGLHPIYVATEIGNHAFDFEYYKTLAVHPKVVGIGECGFDYYRAGHEDKNGAVNLQRQAFEAQIALANEVKKPLMLHLRSGKAAGEDAYQDAFEVMQSDRSRVKVRGDAHFFAGSEEHARQFLDIGFNLSFTGVITYPPSKVGNDNKDVAASKYGNDVHTIIKNMPADRIMSETDAPYVAPVPFRGKRNEPVHVIEVAKNIAAIRGEREQDFLPILVENARKLFGI